MDDSGLKAQLEQCHKESFGWALSCCLGSLEEAETVLQTAYLKILERRARFGGRSTFKTWFFSVIRRTAVEHRRRQMLQRLMLTRYLRKAPSAVQQPAADERIYSTQVQKAVRVTLSALSRRQREVLQLVFYHDLSLADAAKVMGVSLGSARTHYERGKKRVRQWMDGSRIFNESRSRRRENSTMVS
ncbi:MAG TPA: RNA polymerase sigma factor [Acidobacteriota bacterium]|jgi:RNA polymerase sigma-70 factor (ECF subfamily)|nr:RNA polymerase sigma factor [Acidobacteriota bacterium]